MSRKSISKGLRFDVMNRDGFRCRYCGADAVTTTMHIDHRTPVALGGTNDIDNLLTACIDCNLGKHTKHANLTDNLSGDWVECPFADGWPNDIDDAVYFYNGTWAITDFGLERLEKPYVIPRRELPLAARHIPGMGQISFWLHHLCTKKWAARRIEDSIEAVARALRFYEQRPEFDWSASVHFAREKAKLSGRPLLFPPSWMETIRDDEEDGA